MSSDETQPDLDLDRVRDAILDALAAQVLARGVSPDLALAAAHSAIVTAITARHGGPVAAKALRDAAERVEAWPAHGDHPLAAATAAGRA